jgi:5-methylcytosine-specific restriction endonuclease McrA
MADANSKRIVSRAEAKVLGLKRYFTGLPCPAGHVDERATVNGSCMRCVREKNLASYRNDREAALARQGQQRAKPDYNQKKKARRHANDPALAMRVSVREQDHSARAVAASASQSTYTSPRCCEVCGTNKRFTKDGKCVECNRLACLRRYTAKMAAVPGKLERIAEMRSVARKKASQKSDASVRARAIRDARQAAVQSGSLTYVGRPCPKGHSGTRYTKHGSCVECAAMQAASTEKKKYDKARYRERREEILKRSAAYYAANSDRSKAASRAWVLRNPERRQAVAQSYKHRRRTAEQGGITGPELAAWKKAQKKVCHWCGCKCDKRFHVDHIQPLSKGGEHAVTNLCIACPTCNLRKSARDPIEFAQSLGLLL